MKQFVTGNLRVAGKATDGEQVALTGRTTVPCLARAQSKHLENLRVRAGDRKICKEATENTLNLGIELPWLLASMLLEARYGK